MNAIKQIADSAMRSFADRAARLGMLPLNAAQVDAAITTLRSELKDLLTDAGVREMVEAGNATVGALAFDAMVAAALVAAKETK